MNPESFKTVYAPATAEMLHVEPFIHETVLRPATEADWSFITSAWLKSYRHSEFASHVPPQIYFKSHHAIIDRIKEAGAIFTIAAMADNPDVVLGFSCSQLATLHYVYVKLAFRRIGLASRLVHPGVQTVVTHLTKAGAAFKASKLPRAIYNPYAV